MGNRAIITTEDKKIEVYLHWNGGRDSIVAFLKYCKMHEYRSPDVDQAYGFARLTNVIANYMGADDGLSVGVAEFGYFDAHFCDNGVYIIKGWEIADRIEPPEHEQHQHELLDMLLEIDSQQPEYAKLTEKFIREHYKDKDVPNKNEGYSGSWFIEQA